MTTAPYLDPAIPSRRIRWSRLDWPNILSVAVVHAGLFAAPFAFSWSGLAIMLVVFWLISWLGVSMCYHRLLTHGSFEVPRPIKYALTIVGTLSWQDSIFSWVGTHRLHHQHTDDDHDPHSPRHGFSWAYVFCWMTKERVTIDPNDYAKDLARDPVMVFLNRVHYLPLVVLGVGLYFAGEWAGGLGLSWVLWGCCVSTVAVYHATWLVNSACHTWGYQNFDTGDDSTNNPLVALLTHGDGWHNNHHAHPRWAQHGYKKWELDATYGMIRLMERLGLARRVVRQPRHRDADAAAEERTDPTLESAGTVRK